MLSSTHFSSSIRRGGGERGIIQQYLIYRHSMNIDVAINRGVDMLVGGDYEIMMISTSTFTSRSSSDTLSSYLLIL